jgi:hypothetical protein
MTALNDLGVMRPWLRSSNLDKAGYDSDAEFLKPSSGNQPYVSVQQAHIGCFRPKCVAHSEQNSFSPHFALTTHQK